MRKVKIFSIFCMLWAYLMGGFFAQPAQAILGDVNGDSLVNAADVTDLLDYLFLGEAPPANPIDADVDGSPGINIGDVMQLLGYLFLVSDLIPYTGVSVEVGSQIRLSSTVISPDTIVGTTATIPVKIIENEGPDLTGMVIPLSYASDSGEVEVNLDNITFTGGILPANWSTGSMIDNDSNRVVFYAYDPAPVTPVLLDSGTTGTIAELHFTRTSLDSLPLAMSTTQVPPSHSLMLISSYYADTLGGTSPSERIFTPKLSLARKGDCNGDGIINSADVVYLINHLFADGPPPIGL